MYSINFDLPVIGNINIQFASEELFLFTERQFLGYRPKKEKTVLLNEFVKIKIPNKIGKINDIKLSRHFEIVAQNLITKKKFRSFVLENSVFFHEDTIEINIKLKRGVRFYLSLLIRGSYKINHFLFYQTVLYPIFSLYSLFYGYYILHGSVVNIKSKNILITGLDGVGKSKLTSLLIEAGGFLISDNFILFNGQKVMPLNLPVRLLKSDVINDSWIFDASSHVEVLYETILKDEVFIDYSYFLTISKNFDVRKISSMLPSGTLAVINNVADEVREANLYCGNYLFLHQTFSNNEEFNIKNDCYIFNVPKGSLNLALRSILCQVST